jgi:hypothetical protein
VPRTTHCSSKASPLQLSTPVKAHPVSARHLPTPARVQHPGHAKSHLSCLLTLSCLRHTLSPIPHIHRQTAQSRWPRLLHPDRNRTGGLHSLHLNQANLYFHRFCYSRSQSAGYPITKSAVTQRRPAAGHAKLSAQPQTPTTCARCLPLTHRLAQARSLALPPPALRRSKAFCCDYGVPAFK